jgi:hypothetical protein
MIWLFMRDLKLSGMMKNILLTINKRKFNNSFLVEANKIEIKLKMKIKWVAVYRIIKMKIDKIRKIRLFLLPWTLI